MKSWKNRDIRNRNLFKKYEQKRLILKSLIADLYLPMSIRLEAMESLNKLPRNSSITRIRNRCILTGKAQSVDKKTGLSRNILRKLILNGQLVGLKKSSW